MKLRAVQVVNDGRITHGRVYTGQFVFFPGKGLMFVCYDDAQKWVAYDHWLFEPLDGGE